MASPGNQHCANGTLSFPMFTKPKPRAKNNNTVNMCFTNGLYLLTYVLVSLQCFDTVGWAPGRAPGLWKLSDEVLVWLSACSEVQTFHIYDPADVTAIPIISCLIYIQTGFTFLAYWLTEVVLEKRSLNGRSSSSTLCPKKVSSLNILQQPPQICTDLNEILHTQDDIYFCHRRQIS